MFYFNMVDYSYRIRFTFERSEISSEESNFPVLIKLNSDNFDFTKTQYNGIDLVFVLSDNETLLDFERVKYDVINYEAEFWVKIPVLSNSPLLSFYMYFGNIHQTEDLSSSDVWQNNYELVYHGVKKVTSAQIDIVSTEFYLFSKAQEDVYKGLVSFDKDLKVMFLNNYVPNLNEHQFLSDVKDFEISEGKFYSEYGFDLENLSFDRTDDVINWVADKTELKYIEQDINCAVVYQATNDPPESTDRLLMLIIFECDGEQLVTIPFDTTTVLEIDWDLSIVINSSFIYSPTINYPYDNAENIALDAEIESSAFSTFKEADSHIASEWEIYHNDELIHTSNEDPTNLITYTSPFSEVPLGELCQVRCRHKGVDLGWSRWGDFVTYRYATPVPNICSIIKPENNKLLSNVNVLVKGSVFSSPISQETHEASEFELYLNDDLIESESLEAGDLTLVIFRGLSEDTEGYKVRVRYKGAVLGWSEWSGFVNFSISELGYIYVGDGWHNYRLQNTGEELTEKTIAPRNWGVKKFLFHSNGTIYLNIDREIHRINPTTKEVITTASKYGSVTDLNIDYQGFVYGSYEEFNGLARFHPETLATITNYSYNYVYRILITVDNYMFLLSDSGLRKLHVDNLNLTLGWFALTHWANYAIVYKGDYVYIGTDTLILRINRNTMEQKGQAFSNHIGRITNLIIAEDGYLYSFSLDYTIKKIDISNPEVPMQEIGSLSSYYVPAFTDILNEDGYLYFVSDFAIGKLRLSDFTVIGEYGCTIGTYTLSTQPYSFYLDSENKLYVSYSNDGIVVLNNETFELIDVIISFIANYTLSMNFLKNNVYAFERTNYSGHVRVIKYDNNLNFKELHYVQTEGSYVPRSVLLHNNYFYIGKTAVRISKVQSSDLTEVTSFASSSTNTSYHSYALAADKYGYLYSGGRTLHSGYSSTYDIMKFNAVTLEFLSFMSGHTNLVYALYCDDNYLYSGGHDGRIIKWDLLTGTLVDQFAWTAEQYYSLVGDEEYLYAGLNTGIIRKIRKSDLEQITFISPHSQVINCLYLDVDGFLYSGSSDYTVKVFDTLTMAQVIPTYTCHSNVYSITGN